MKLGTPGTGTTDLYVQNQSRFISTSVFEGDVNFDGNVSSTNLTSNGGNILQELLQLTNTLRVGSSTTTLSAYQSGCWYWNFCTKRES